MKSGWRSAPATLDLFMQKAEDLTKKQIHQLVSLQLVEQTDLMVWKQINYIINQEIASPTLSDTNICSPIEATPYLNQCRVLIDKHLKKQARIYPPFQWLWYLRRLPHSVFAGTFNSTSAYDQTLAEIVSGQSERNDKKYLLPNKPISYSVNLKEIQKILQFCAGVRMLSHIHVLLRLAGKGCEFHFHEDESIPASIRTPEQNRAIRLYDNRQDQHGQIFSRAGTAISLQTLEPLEEGTIMSVLGTLNPAWAPSFLRNSKGNLERVSIFTQYVPRFISLNQLADLAADPRLNQTNWLSKEVGAILILLSMSFEMRLHAETGFTTIQRYGYYIVKRNALRQEIDRHFHKASTSLRKRFPTLILPSSVNQLLQISSRNMGQPWPMLSGPIIRHVGKDFCVDLNTATMRLNHLLEFPNLTGDIANARADHFELSVQEMINLSQWCPSQKLGDLRGKTLRYQGKEITDIDAIGEIRDTLLIVSCKSMIYSSKYDTGDYATIRNRSSDIEQYVSYWEKISEFLQKNPKGDNYDLSNYKIFLSPVCTPQPIYILIGNATKKIILTGCTQVYRSMNLTTG